MTYVKGVNESIEQYYSLQSHQIVLKCTVIFTLIIQIKSLNDLSVSKK